MTVPTIEGHSGLGSRNRVTLMPAKLFSVVAAVSGMLTVMLGAFGAHALKKMLSSEWMVIYHTAVQYQMFHSLALLLLAVLMMTNPNTHASNKWLLRSGAFFIFGLVVFCGSLYALAITQIRILGAITPIGGAAFIVAWLCMVVGILNKRTT